MKLIIEKNTMYIVPENEMDQAYLETIIGFEKEGRNNVIVERKDAGSTPERIKYILLERGD